ncbi:CLUMA_CG007587, isoform A [Clunio marinus]|uniref:CLUMA_CG007587, isoform A n=1 Tax=Clunio marinus TaxID=568069 RepID=A0A1J1I155_9DIPT|nr:CLUMA_CG007587, isoform A [Clunio marinus]
MKLMNCRIFENRILDASSHSELTLKQQTQWMEKLLRHKFRYQKYLLNDEHSNMNRSVSINSISNFTLPKEFE